MSPNQSAITVVKQFQSETDAIREAPGPGWARATVLTLSGFIVSMAALMFLTMMDRIVSSAPFTATGYGGIIMSTHQLNVFQALDASIIRSLDVKEGDQVAAGQLLATLDPTISTADVLALKLQIASLQTQIARDEAELAQKPLVFPESSDPDFLKYAALQRALYDTRIANYTAQVNAFDAQIRLAQATIVKYTADEGGYQTRLNIARDLEKMHTTLANKGYDSILNMLLSQDQAAEMNRFHDYQHNALLEAQQTLESTTANREAFIQQWFSTASQDLVTSRGTLDTATQSLDKAKLHQDVVRWTAMEPSVVLTVGKFSVGSVLQPGTQLFTLMPLNTPVEADIKISPLDVGFIRTGDLCTLKIDAFDYQEFGTAEGKVQWISEGALTVDDNGAPSSAYYRAQCSVDATYFKGVPPNFRLIPGMTLQADVKVGTRSVAMYLLSGMLRGYKEAMRVPR